MKKIGFVDRVHPILEDGLSGLGWTCIDLTSVELETLKTIVHEYHGLVIRSRVPMDEEMLKLASKLEFIARSGAGMENIDVAYCDNNDIALFNAPEGNRNAVGEHALGMLLALFNKLVKANIEIGSGVWDREGNRGIELDGKTIGIIGYGNNGEAFANKLKGFDVKVLAYDKYKTNYGNDWVTECEMADLFDQVDVLSFHIPQNKETMFMGNTAFFGQFKKPIHVINLSRGKIIETKALVNALKSGEILGACLDVLEYEKSSFENMFSKENDLPKDFQFLLNSERVILSPHVGGWTKESYLKLSQTLLEKIKNNYNL